MSSISSNCRAYSFFVNQIKKLSIQIRQLLLNFVSRNATWDQILIFFSFNQIHYFVIQIR